MKQEPAEARNTRVVGIPVLQGGEDVKYHRVDDAAPTLGCRIRRWLLAVWVVGGSVGAAWLAASQSSWWLLLPLVPINLLLMVASVAQRDHGD